MSKKKLMYVKEIYYRGLVKGMKKYKIIDDLKMFGVYVNENADIDTEVLREVYMRVLKYLVDKYNL